MPTSTCKRASLRLATMAPIHVRRSFACRMEADLRDLSIGGCRVDLAERICAGERLWIAIPGLERLEARTRWADGFNAGVEFATPLHAAVLAMLGARLNASV